MLQLQRNGTLCQQMSKSKEVSHISSTTSEIQANIPQETNNKDGSNKNQDATSGSTKRTNPQRFKSYANQYQS